MFCKQTIWGRNLPMVPVSHYVSFAWNNGKKSKNKTVEIILTQFAKNSMYSGLAGFF